MQSPSRQEPVASRVPDPGAAHTGHHGVLPGPHARLVAGGLGDDGAGDVGNRLLSLLALEAPVEHAELMLRTTRVMLPRATNIFSPQMGVPAVYFPEGAVASVVKRLASGKQVEVGTTGLEGMVGLPAFLGAEDSPLECFIQVAGEALRLETPALLELATGGTALHRLLQRYTQYLFDQAAQSVACNRLHRVDARCARWLLMTLDRVPGNGFELKQEYLATMLGVRRASVSEAAEDLQEAGAIRYRRGKMTIVDRARLELASCECYASDRADYERLFPAVALRLAQRAV